MHREWMGLFGLLMLMSGCAQYDTKAVDGPPRPAPGATPKLTKQQRPDVSVRLVGSQVEVSASGEELCRDVETTAAVRDRTTERNITKQGNTVQLVTGALAVIAVGAGIYYLAAPCKKSVTSSTGGSTGTRPCTTDETKSQRTGAIAALAIGGVVSIPFVVNAIRGEDTSTTVPAKPIRTSNSWRHCGNQPMAGASVQVTLPDGTKKQAVLDDEGKANLDLAALPVSKPLLRHPYADVVLGGQVVATVALAALPQVVAAKREMDEQEIRRSNGSSGSVEDERCSFSVGDGSCLDQCDTAYSHCTDPWMSCGYQLKDCIHGCGCETSHER